MNGATTEPLVSTIKPPKIVISTSTGRSQNFFRAIMNAGQPFGILPYGTEALGVMRIEKGHVAGNEINGQTTAHDLNLARMLSKKKDDRPKDFHEVLMQLRNIRIFKPEKGPVAQKTSKS